MDTTWEDSSRFVDWCTKITGYSIMNRNQKKRAKRKYNNMDKINGWGQIKIMNRIETVNSLVDCCEPAPTPCALRFSNCLMCSMGEVKPTQKEKAMDTTYTIDESKRDYLRNRIDQIGYQKSDQLEKTYGLVDDEAPKTPQELVDRIKSGMVTYPTDEEFDKMNRREISVLSGWNPVKPGSTLRWRDPAMKEDRAGYTKAMSDFRAAEQPVYDAINILDPKDTLVILQEFEKATLH